MHRVEIIAALPLALACNAAPERVDYHEQREPCAQRDPARSVLFGDLHVHTRLSFDAYGFDVRTTPEEAYRFARGETVRLPPLGADGVGTRPVRLARPLDFAAVTDHSEFLGEIESCTLPGSDGYDTPGCVAYRRGGNAQVALLGLRLTTDPERPADLCGADPGACARLGGQVWARVQRAANEAYDRTTACRFTALIGYEYSAAPLLSTLHRNVIFRSDRVPAPTTYFEQPTAPGLWRELGATCLDAPDGCDALAIPHNPNESNGNQFFIDAQAPVDDARAAAALRARLEPVLEVYQHKGDSECMNGLAGMPGAPDELCEFEKQTRTPQSDCGNGTGRGGTSRMGCYSRRDFARGILLAGLSEEARLGKNPFQLGFVASTDTHNGTPGAVSEGGFLGHRGLDDDTPQKRLGPGELTPGGLAFSPGGLTAVWAEENSREAVFDALRRREVYGTSGPRLAVRFFGGALPTGLCGDAGLVTKAYGAGVPMGGVLRGATGMGGAPRFVLSALRDPDGARLRLAQIIKGWIDGSGQGQVRVYDVAGRKDGPGVDKATCQPQGTAEERGTDSLCTEWVDPDFDPALRAFYYARVLEEPTCRWSALECLSLPVAQRPVACADAAMKLIQERAWTSPIWYQP